MKITQEQLEKIVESATKDALKTILKEGTLKKVTKDKVYKKTKTQK